jgi:Tol biopolymer transport system component
MRSGPPLPSVSLDSPNPKEEVSMSKLSLLGALVLALAASTTAQATAPGKNGLILFMHNVGAHEQVFTMRPNGTQIRQLTHFSDSAAADASWSVDGKRIAFARDFDLGKPTEHLDIYTMNADGTDQHGMGLKGLNGGPVWFADGRRILFLRPTGLWVIPAAGGTPHRLIGGDNSDAVISPSGQEVAFLRSKGSGSALFVASLNNGRAKQITPWSLHAGDKIDWAPDGSRILSHNDQGVFTVGSDGSGLTMLARGGDYCSESFSPDGTKVLFIDHCSSHGVKSNLLTMNLDGTDVKRIPNVHGHWVSWGLA